MLQPRLFALVILSLAGVASFASLAMAESRFGRQVAKLENPKGFEFVTLEDARFPVLRKSPATVACIAYRDPQRYYVEVAVMNQSDQPLELKKDFVQLKSDAAFAPVDSVVAAAEVQKTAGSTVQLQAVSTSRSSTIAGIAANPDRSSSADLMAAAMVEKEKAQASQLAARLTAFGHEKQSLVIEPKTTRFYIFVFEPSGKKKPAFEIAISAGAEALVFPYRE